jgi:hypothetical protein
MSVNQILDSANLISRQWLPPPYNATYGQFSSTQTQVVLGANTPTPITYNTTEIANGISFDVGTPSRVVVSVQGVYKFAYSIQLDKTGGGTSFVDFFIRINGNNVPRSTSRAVVVGQNGETFVYCEYLLPINAGGNVEVIMYSPDATMAATYFPAVVGPPAVPEVPSIITTIVQIA